MTTKDQVHVKLVYSAFLKLSMLCRFVNSLSKSCRLLQ